MTSSVSTMKRTSCRIQAGSKDYNHVDVGANTHILLYVIYDEVTECIITYFVLILIVLFIMPIFDVESMIQRTAMMIMSIN